MTIFFKISLTIFVLSTSFFSKPAFAVSPSINTGDTAWMLTATTIVLLMTIPGVALFYGGMARKKNVLSVLMQSFTITCLISIIWMVIGYSLAFSNGESSFTGNLDFVFLTHLKATDINGSIPDSLFIIFQMTFAIITAALITGALAERMKFSALLWFISLWSIIVYSPVTFWVWGGGFLGDAGVLDFAGGTVVHINSGIAALVACIMLGKRTGYGVKNLAPHNLVLTIIGASLLWAGWFGFNAGSALGANGSAGMAIIVTQVAAAAGGLAWMFIEWSIHKKPTILGIVSGAVAGLVAITPAAGFVNPMGALAIGVSAGLICFWGATSLKQRLKYDDSFDVFAVHGLGGIAGAILTGLFAVETIGGTAGALEGNISQIGTQMYGILATIAWSAIATVVIIFIIDKAIGIRVDKDSEAEGLDISQHGEVIQ